MIYQFGVDHQPQHFDESDVHAVFLVLLVTWLAVQCVRARSRFVERRDWRGVIPVAIPFLMLGTTCTLLLNIDGRAKFQWFLPLLCAIVLYQTRQSPAKTFGVVLLFILSISLVIHFYVRLVGTLDYTGNTALYRVLNDSRRTGFLEEIARNVANGVEPSFEYEEGFVCDVFPWVRDDSIRLFTIEARWHTLITGVYRRSMNDYRVYWNGSRHFSATASYDFRLRTEEKSATWELGGD